MPQDKKLCVNPDNASHNLDSKLDDQDRPPTRDVGEADFAAEAHGFTAYEKAGQGSSYQGSLDESDASDDKKVAKPGLLVRVRTSIMTIFRR